MRIPNLYIKWHAFREMTDAIDTDKDVGIHIFRHEDGAEPFSKMLRGDIGCQPDIADALTKYMNGRIAALNRRRSDAGGPDADAELRPADLSLPTLTFAARLLELLPNATEASVERAHQAIVRDMNIEARAGSGAELKVERFAMDRSFASMLPSGGSGPMVFQAGRHRGQLAVIGVDKAPIAAYTLLTRDPAPMGCRIWDLAWGEAVLWLPSPSRPPLEQGRLLLMPQAEPVQATPGHFRVTTVLVWRDDALKSLDPRGADSSPGALSEGETALFLTRLRRMIDDKRRRWTGAVTALTAEYDVAV